jgi:hypothetical protein
MTSYTAFAGHKLLASGPRSTVAIAVKHAPAGRSAPAVLVFDDETGRVIDLDTRGSDADVAARYAEPAAEREPVEEEEPRGRGRPKLGVVAREVTLLPRHWEWLAAQSGGASVALRKLVEEARRTNAAEDRRRARRDAAYREMSAIAGDFPHFEEAARALFAGEATRFKNLIKRWPADIRRHLTAMAFE